MAKPCYHCAELLPDSSGLHTPSHYSKRKEQRREQERDRDKVGGLKKKKRERKWCSWAFQRLFQSSVTRFNLFLIRQGHCPHIFQTPHCYQIQFRGQLQSWLTAQEPVLLPIWYISIYAQAWNIVNLLPDQLLNCVMIHMDVIMIVHSIILVSQKASGYFWTMMACYGMVSSVIKIHKFVYCTLISTQNSLSKANHSTILQPLPVHNPTTENRWNNTRMFVTGNSTPQIFWDKNKEKESSQNIQHRWCYWWSQ